MAIKGTAGGNNGNLDWGDSGSWSWGVRYIGNNTWDISSIFGSGVNFYIASNGKLVTNNQTYKDVAIFTKQ